MDRSDQSRNYGMDVVEFLASLQTMCMVHDKCEGCPLCTDLPCVMTGDPCDWHPEAGVIKAVAEWNKKMGPKTIKDVVFERLPHVKKGSDGLPFNCPCYYFDDGKNDDDCERGTEENCVKCWSRIAPDEYQSKEYIEMKEKITDG